MKCFNHFLGVLLVLLLTEVAKSASPSIKPDTVRDVCAGLEEQIDDIYKYPDEDEDEDEDELSDEGSVADVSEERKAAIDAQIQNLYTAINLLQEAIESTCPEAKEKYNNVIICEVKHFRLQR